MIMTTQDKTEESESETPKLPDIGRDDLLAIFSGMIEKWERDILAHNQTAEWHDERFSSLANHDDILKAKCERVNACNIRTRIDDVKSTILLSNIESKAKNMLDWLGKQGLCWREADAVDEWWKIGDETEWFYGDADKLSKTIKHHKLILLDSFN